VLKDDWGKKPHASLEIRIAMGFNLVLCV
jgi:hypothetical protein